MFINKTRITSLLKILMKSQMGKNRDAKIKKKNEGRGKERDNRAKANAESR